MAQRVLNYKPRWPAGPRHKAAPAVAQTTLGAHGGRFYPDYQLHAWKQGDPRHRLSSSDVNLRTVTAIQTSKTIYDVSGEFTITLKDGRAMSALQEMDVVDIHLKGGDGAGFQKVMRGVVDTVRPAGSADEFASSEDVVIEGRCASKYLQETSLFLPVWDPNSNLPTALIFGLGDGAKKVGGNTPYDIFDYLIQLYTWGKRNLVGASGIPNSRFWLDHRTRFDKIDFFVPFLQFNEDTMATVLQTLQITGFTEAWVDELGRVVYRHPQWDAPVSYLVPTSRLMSGWSFPRTDQGAATYVEVIPAGDPGLTSAQAQALRAGRAPVPTSYTQSNNTAWHVSQEFVIETDKKGAPTAKGKQNYWYKMQRRLGLRPQQVVSPLIFDQAEAQKQAEGLLRFYSRLVKTCSFSVVGSPSARLGRTMRCFGDLNGQQLDRVFYLDGVSHEYVESDHYTTSIQGSHGRDPWDPKWGEIALPKWSPAALAKEGGVLLPAPPNSGGGAAFFTPGGSSAQLGKGTYSAVVSSGLNFAGPDQGIDFTGTGNVFVLDACVVTNVIVGGSGWPGGNLVCYQLTAGPYRSRYVYIAEAIQPLPGLHKGVTLAKGQQIATLDSSYPGLEMGWSQDAHGTAYGSPSDGKGGNAAPYGVDFGNVVQRYSSGQI